jgi:ADP-ribosyl-[dinitrogen reductase] hydrolase
LKGEPLERLLEPGYEPVGGLWEREPLDPEIERVAFGSYLVKEPPRIRGTGYVVESLEAALWAVSRTESFREAVLAAANLGDDADTTAAIAGQLAGAAYGIGGEQGIPEAWVEKLAMRERIDALASRLFEASGLEPEIRGPRAS